MSKNSNPLSPRSTQSEVKAFLERVASIPATTPTDQRGRLVFAMDATASRGPSWEQACRLQGRMFEETMALGGLDVQLCYYRSVREFSAGPWTHNADALLMQMDAVRCRGGYTQIERVLQHACSETKQHKVNALVFVGDCMEEDMDRLCNIAGQLGLLGVPAFMFQEGYEPLAERTFREIAALTKGAYCPFDAGSAQQLRDLLSAVAVYAAGGRKALADFSKRKKGIALQLSHQIDK